MEDLTMIWQNLRHIEKIPAEEREAFGLEVIALCGRLGGDPNGLMEVMGFETIYTFRPNIMPNKNLSVEKQAVGLIQFMPNTARWLGTTNTALALMSRVGQLHYVEKYFFKSGAKGKLNTAFDWYCFVFYPIARTKPDEWLCGSEKSPTYAALVGKQNPSLDKNKDGFISVSDLKNKFPATPLSTNTPTPTQPNTKAKR